MNEEKITEKNTLKKNGNEIITKNNLISIMNIIIGTSIPIILPQSASFIMPLYNELFRRVEKLRDNTLNDITISQINTEYFCSLEFRNLVKKAVENACNDKNDEKIIFYSKILKDSLITNEERRKYSYTYMDILGEMSIQEIYVLRELYLQQKDIDQSRIKKEMLVKKEEFYNLSSKLKEYGIKDEETKFLYKRLESKGLISEITGTYINYDGGIYYITYNSRELMVKLDSS